MRRVLTRWLIALAVLAGSVGGVSADEDPGERVALNPLWWVRYPPREHAGWVGLVGTAHRGPVDPARLPALTGSATSPCSLVEQTRLPSGVRQVVFTCGVSSNHFWSLIEHPSGTYLLSVATPRDNAWAQDVIRSLEPREPPDELVVGHFVFPREIAAGPLESFHPDESDHLTIIALVTPPGVPAPSVTLWFGTVEPPDGKRGARGPKVRLLGRPIETFPPRDGSLPMGLVGMSYTKLEGFQVALSARTEEELRLSIQILESMRVDESSPHFGPTDLVSIGPPPLRKGRWVMSKRPHPMRLFDGRRSAVR